MKKMSDRKMDMKGGEVDSDGFFPSAPKHRVLPRVGMIKGFHYPDLEEDIHRDQEEFVKDASKDQPKTGFRH